MNIDRFTPGLCACCRKREVGKGYMPPGGRGSKKILWVCDNQDCIDLARDSYAMKPDQFTRIESLAAQKGGEAGGAYLDEIGKFDLRELTIDEFCEFNRRVVAGYRVALVTDLRDEVPF